MCVSMKAFSRLLMVSLIAIGVVSKIAAYAEDSGSYVCTVKGTPIASLTKSTPYSAFHGARYYFNSSKSKSDFLENPVKYASEAAKTPGVKASFLFDPVSTKRLNPEMASAHSDYKGIRFFFSSAAHKQTFDASPEKYGSVPMKDALFCPVANLAEGSYGAASDYSDVEGTRYFFCCKGCKEQFEAKPSKYLDGYEEKLKKHHLKFNDDLPMPTISNGGK